MPAERDRALLGGGTDGNERLTAIAGVLLLLLFAVLGVTIWRIGQLLWLHLFLGLLLIGSRDQLLLWHKVSFIVWLVAMAPHVLGHLVELPPALRLTRPGGGPVAPDGGAGRAIALASAIVGGAVLAIVLLPDFSAWTASAAHFHHHHHH